METIEILLSSELLFNIVSVSADEGYSRKAPERLKTTDRK